MRAGGDADFSIEREMRRDNALIGNGLLCLFYEKTRVRTVKGDEVRVRTDDHKLGCQNYERMFGTGGVNSCAEDISVTKGVF